MFVIGLLGVIFGGSSLVLSAVFIWDNIRYPPVTQSNDAGMGESINDAIELCNLEYAYSL